MQKVWVLRIDKIKERHILLSFVLHRRALQNTNLHGSSFLRTFEPQK